MVMLISGISGNLQAQYNGCNNNTFLQSDDPNTIEYDNMISTFHSTMVREASGKVLIWGEKASTKNLNVLSPLEINSNNFSKLKGDILKFSASSNHLDQREYTILTTEGLYRWGYTKIGSKINLNPFDRVKIGTYGVNGLKADGLPKGVSPKDVKMLFGTHKTLAITTNSGEAWVLSSLGKINGDGTQVNLNNPVWHRVKTGKGKDDFLTNVVAIRGSSHTLMALTRKGKIYTWGEKCYLGDGTPKLNKLYATEMKLPTDWPAVARPKMIGMSVNTYYLLASDGTLYSLGNNKQKQIGDFTSIEDRTTWVHVKKSPGENMTNITWISPQEHDYLYSAINVLTSDGKLYSWGANDGHMLDSSSSVSINPTYMPGGLNKNDRLMAVETGGHTTMLVKQCSQTFGYIGHRVNGSMGNGSDHNAHEKTYTFSTAKLNLCGAQIQPDVMSKKICPGTTVDLTATHTSITPTGFELKWYTTSTREAGTEVVNSTNVGPGTYYAFYIPNIKNTCDNPIVSEPVVISELVSGDSEYKNCSSACKKPIAIGVPLRSKFGISSRQTITDKKWPNNIPNGHLVLDAAKKGLVITHMTTAQINALIPVAGMIVYDTDVKCVKLYRNNNPKVKPERKGWVCIQQGCN